jgi:hypothetical protein
MGTLKQLLRLNMPSKITIKVGGTNKPNRRQNYQQTNLAPNKPTQENIKHLTEQKKRNAKHLRTPLKNKSAVSNFCHRTSGTFGFGLPTSRPFYKAKRTTFSLRTKDSTDKTTSICRIPT